LPDRVVRAWATAVVGLLLLGTAWAPPAGAANSSSGDAPAPSPAPPAAVQPAAPEAQALAAAPIDSGTWGPVLDWGVQGKHMTMLSTGKVLVWSTGDNARVWDPSTGTFTLAPATFGDLHCAGQSTLADGRVIVIGGVIGSPHNGTRITSLFDPVSQTWTRGTDMAYERWVERLAPTVGSLVAG